MRKFEQDLLLEAFSDFELTEAVGDEEDDYTGAEKFSISDTGIDDLDSFLDVGDEEFEDDGSVEVVDTDAETEDDLEPSYEGKVIVDCDVCHSNMFYDPKEIDVDEDGKVTIGGGDECPYCMSTEGFTVLGQVAPYDPNADFSEEEGELGDEMGDEFGDEELEGSGLGDEVEPPIDDEELPPEEDRFKAESLEAILSEAAKIDDECCEEECDESMSRGDKKKRLKALAKNESMSRQEKKKALLSIAESCDDEECLDEGATKKEVVSKLKGSGLMEGRTRGMSRQEKKKALMSIAESCDDLDEAYDDLDYKLHGKSGSRRNQDYRVRSGNGNRFSDSNVTTDFDSVEGAQRERDRRTDRRIRKRDALNKLGATMGEGMKLDGVNELKGEKTLHRRKDNIKGDARIDGESKNAKEIVGSKTYKESVGRRTKDDPWGLMGKKSSRKVENRATRRGHSMREDVNIKTDDDITIEQNEMGGLNVSTGSDVDDFSLEGGAEMIAPLDDEIKGELPTEALPPDEAAEFDLDEMPIDSSEEPMGDEDMMGDEMGEEPMGDEYGEEDVDIPMDDFDEEEFDEYGESLFRENYSNVRSFKTTGISQTKNSLMVEGLLTFDSGNVRKTSFTFNPTYANGRQKRVVFEGYNDQTNTPLSLRGRVRRGKFITESLKMKKK